MLPLARMKTALFGDLLASTPFCVYGGAGGGDAEAAAALEAHAIELQRRPARACLEFRRLRLPVPDPAELRLEHAAAALLHLPQADHGRPATRPRT